MAPGLKLEVLQVTSAASTEPRYDRALSDLIYKKNKKQTSVTTQKLVYGFAAFNWNISRYTIVTLREFCTSASGMVESRDAPYHRHMREPDIPTVEAEGSTDEYIL